MCACELRARWWLAAAVYSLAAYAQTRTPSVRCPPNAEECIQVDNQTFIIKGQPHWMAVKDHEFTAACGALTLDDDWPAFTKPVGFASVVVTNCTPPTTRSYMEALEALNISITRSLSLKSLPKVTLTVNSLLHIPTNLELQASEELVLPPDLMPRQNFLRGLKLGRVRVGRLPPRLHDLELVETGLTELLPGILNLTGIVKIEERLLQHINQSGPYLTSLKLITPGLKTLVLYDTSLVALKEGFLGACSNLTSIELRQLRGSQVDYGFLFGAPYLETFRMVESNITSLPEDFFSYTPRLTNIDLSHNQLANINQNFFTGLNKLKELNLGSNNLVLHDMMVVSKVTTLEWLVISGNNFKDFCPHGSKSILAHLNLTYLDLSKTNLTHVCRDWLEDLRWLKTLDLTNNRVHTLSCNGLRILRDPAVKAAIRLGGNPLAYDCSSHDSAAAVSSSTAEQSVKVYLPDEECTCGFYWMIRMAQALGIETVDPRERGVNYIPHCAVEWIDCL